MLNTSLAIFISIMILVQAWVVRVHVKTWIFPACLYGFFWFLYTFIPLIALSDVEINPVAIGYIFLTCLMFSLTSILFNWRLAFEQYVKRAPIRRYDSGFLRLIFYTFGVASTFATMINWRMQGFNFYDIVFNLLDVSNQYLAKRYSGDLTVNLFSQLSTTLGYSAAIIGGILFSSASRGGQRLIFISISLLPSLLVMLVEAAKGALLLALVFFWSGMLLQKLSVADLKIFSFRKLLKLAPLLIILSAALVFSFLARGIDSSEGFGFVVGKLFYYFASYSSGHLYAFSDWFSSVSTGQSKVFYSSIEGSNGFYTFMAVFNVLGTDLVVPDGVYDEYFYIPDLLQTNIYTHYRGLIQDFGFAGSVLVVVASGLIVHFMFFHQLVSRRPAFSISFFAHFLGYTYTSFIISMLIWKSVYVSFVVVALVLFLNNLIKPNRSRTPLIN